MTTKTLVSRRTVLEIGATLGLTWSGTAAAAAAKPGGNAKPGGAKPGEKKRVKSALARKRDRKKRSRDRDWEQNRG